jgi:hypothetical protein
MMSSKPAWENDRYIVLRNPDKIGYIVMNKQTSVVEAEEEPLPDAISVAEHLNVFMDLKIWEEQVDQWRSHLNDGASPLRVTKMSGSKH